MPTPVRSPRDPTSSRDEMMRPPLVLERSLYYLLQKYEKPVVKTSHLWKVNVFLKKRNRCLCQGTTLEASCFKDK